MAEKEKNENPVDFRSMLNRTHKLFLEAITPKTIMKSGPVTGIYWGDGEKTFVQLMDGENADDYTAFCVALAKRLFGSTLSVKKVLKEAKVIER